MEKRTRRPGRERLHALTIKWKERTSSSSLLQKVLVFTESIILVCSRFFLNRIFVLCSILFKIFSGCTYL